MTHGARLLDEAFHAARMLLNAAPVNVEPIAAGANSRIYRVEHGGASYALKRYPLMSAEDPRDRQGCERRALELMRAEGIETVPAFLDGDPQSGFSLIEWLDGRQVTDVQDRDAAEAVVFVGQTAQLPQSELTRAFPPASEACLSGREILRQIEGRRERLLGVCRDDAVLANFFEGGFGEALDESLTRAVDLASQHGLDLDIVLPQEGRSLIPADFGFHNALRMDSGSLRFIDFEYFGWDDPVKLSVDFLVHPSVTLTEAQKEVILEGLLSAYGSGLAFEKRLEAWKPLLVVRWALIMLNIFLPHYQKARGHLGDQGDLMGLKRTQIEKVKNFLREHAARAWE